MKSTCLNPCSFQQVISRSISKALQSFPQSQLLQFSQQLSNLPKKIKQLNADPYLFVFQLLFTKQQLKSFALKQLHFVVQNGYCTKQAFTRIANLLRQCLSKQPNQVEPNEHIIDLFFQIYSTVLLPQDVARRVRQLGYFWLIRVFQMKQAKIPLYLKLIYDKIGVYEIPTLSSIEDQHKQLQKYVYKVFVTNILNKVEDRIQNQMCVETSIQIKQKKGKYLYCFMCQKAADYYCKDTKVSVCGSQCKKDHLLYMSQTNIINQKFTQAFKQKIQQMLFNNWYTKRSPSLSVDYLTSIYIFSDYTPQIKIQHSKIVHSPIMIQKVWLLYGAYYQRKEQMFQHIFVDFLYSKNQYLQQMARLYFMDISTNHRILDVYYNLDYKQNLRILPYILSRLQQDKQLLSSFLCNIIEIMPPSPNPYCPSLVTQKLIQSFNEHLNPIQQLMNYFGQNKQNKQNIHKQYEQISKFIIKNQFFINKNKLTELLEENQQFIRIFLRFIVRGKKGSPIDQLIRQVFFFINVNISEKIYRLLQILYDQYDIQQYAHQDEKQYFQKNDALFQYFYVIIMVTTQLHNPNLIKSPSAQQVIQRVSHINKRLSTQKPQIITKMFLRLKEYPFSQQSHGILSVYSAYKFYCPDYNTFFVSSIILENYQCFLSSFGMVQIGSNILEKIIWLVIGQVQVGVKFFKMLLAKLNQKQGRQHQQLELAVTNIIQQQPNLVDVEGGWAIIFNYIKNNNNNKKLTIYQKPVRSSTIGQNISNKQTTTNQKKRKIFQNHLPKNSSSQNIIFGLSIQSVISACVKLSDDNLLYFLKDFVGAFTIDNHIAQYQIIIQLNNFRLSIIANILMHISRNINNPWNLLKLIQFISRLPQIQVQSSQKKLIKTDLILLMLKQIQIQTKIQSLIVETIVMLVGEELFIKTKQIWQFITHVALQFQSIDNQIVIQNLIKLSSNSQQFYQSLIVQKTLKNPQPKLLNPDLLGKLHKLQPYLNDLSTNILKIFIRNQNISVIQSNISVFLQFQQTFQLFSQNIDKINNIKYIVEFLIQTIDEIIRQKKYISSLVSCKFIQFVFVVLKKQLQAQLKIKIFTCYIKLVTFSLQQFSYNQKTINQKSIIIYKMGCQLHYLNMKILQSLQYFSHKNSDYNQLLKTIKQSCILVQITFNKFNNNIDYRRRLTDCLVFKHIRERYQKKQCYIISFIKQQIQCKRNIIHILKHSLSQNNKESMKIQYNQFIQNEINIMTTNYDYINQVCLNENKYKQFDSIKLNELIKFYGQKLKFLLNTLVEFYQKQNKQQLEISTKNRKFLLKLLLNGVYKIDTLTNVDNLKSSNKQINNCLSRQPLMEFIKKQKRSIQIQNILTNIFDPVE